MSHSGDGAFERRRFALRALFATTVVQGALTACGGGSGGSPPTAAPPPPPPAPGPAPAPVPAPTPAPVPPPPAIPQVSFAGRSEEVAPPLPAFVYRPLQVPCARFDPVRGEVLVSVVTGADSYALYGLDPATLQTRWIVPVSSFVSRITLSDDAAYAYFALPDEGAVQQFDLATRASVRKFVVADPASGRGPLDVAARPGAPQTVAVSIGFLAAASPYDELSLYDAGVKRPRSMGVVNNGTQVIGDRAPEIEFVDADTLVSFDNETTATTMQRISVVSDGLLPQRSISGVSSEGFHADLRFIDGALYLDFGLQIDPSTLRVVRSFNGVAWNREHNGCYHPGLRSFVRMTPFFDGNSSDQFRLLFEEYDGTRNVLRRRFRIDTPPIAANTQIGSPVFLACEPIGGGRLLAVVYDQASSQVALFSTDVSAIAAYPSPTFARQSASADGLAVVSISVPAHHMAYDPVGNRLVGATPVWTGAMGNSVVILDATTGELLRTVPMSSEPWRVVVAPQIGAAYVSLAAEGVVQQVFLDTGALGWRAVLDWPTRQGFIGPPAGPSFAFDLAVKPDDPLTVAVSAGTFEALLVLRNGQIVGAPLDWLSIRGVVPNRIAWRGNNEIVAYDMFSSATTLSRFSWDGANLALLSEATPVFTMFDTHAKFAFDRLYGVLRVCVVPDGALLGDFVFAYDDTTLAAPDVCYALRSDWNTAPGMLRIDARVLDTTSAGTDRMPTRSSFRILDERFQLMFGNEITSLGGTRMVITQLNDDRRTGYVYIVTAPAF